MEKELVKFLKWLGFEREMSNSYSFRSPVLHTKIVFNYVNRRFHVSLFFIILKPSVSVVQNIFSTFGFQSFSNKLDFEESVSSFKNSYVFETRRELVDFENKFKTYFSRFKNYLNKQKTNC